MFIVKETETITFSGVVLCSGRLCDLGGEFFMQFLLKNASLFEMIRRSVRLREFVRVSCWKTCSPILFDFH